MQNIITEEEILKRLDEFNAACAALKELNKQKPKPTPIPVPCRIEDYYRIRSGNTKAETDYEQRLSDARNRQHNADKALFQAIPANVWIALPSRKISIGFETGTWGGHCHALHIAHDDVELGKLPHVTYYP